MKFLGDMGVSQTVINTLRNDGYDAIHLRDEGLQNFLMKILSSKQNRKEG